MQIHLRICVLCYLAVIVSAQFMNPKDVMVDEKAAPIGESVHLLLVYPVFILLYLLVCTFYVLFSFT